MENKNYYMSISDSGFSGARSPEDRKISRILSKTRVKFQKLINFHKLDGFSQNWSKTREYSKKFI